MAARLRGEHVPTGDHQRGDHGTGRVASPSSARPLARLLDQRLQLILFGRARWRLDGHDPTLWVQPFRPPAVGGQAVDRDREATDEQAAALSRFAVAIAAASGAEIGVVADGAGEDVSAARAWLQDHGTGQPLTGEICP